MRIIAAVDILGGKVVRGVAGNRATYKPIQSKLCDSSKPLDIILALREKCGVEEFYVADLDAILERSRNVWLYEALAKEGVTFWLDAGSRHCQDLRELECLGVKHNVVGLETWRSMEEFQMAFEQFGANLIFSLDMKNGELLSSGGPWEQSSPIQMIDALARTGLKQLLLLDLAQVGTLQGVGTHSLVRHARQADQNWSILAGGGVRSREDLEMLKLTGADGCLVASALHDQTLTRKDVLELTRS